MDNIPMQTLRHDEKPSTEELVTNLTLEVQSINRNFKPTVRTRREYEPEDEVAFDIQLEKELEKIDSEVENFHLKVTLPKIQEELDLWVHEYKDLLGQLQKLHEDEPEHQVREIFVIYFEL